MKTAKLLLFSPAALLLRGSVTILFFGVTLMSLVGCNALEIHPNPAFMPPTVTPIPSEVAPISVTYTPEVTLKSEQVTPIPVFSVTADTLEIRSGAGENFPNVGYLFRGDRVQVYNRSVADTASCREWAQINADGTRWVCADYLK